MKQEDVADERASSSSVDAPVTRETTMPVTSDNNVEQEKVASLPLRARDVRNPSAVEAQADLRNFARQHMVCPRFAQLTQA
jgi:hypothetical protein